MAESWRLRAFCVSQPELWFKPGIRAKAEALHICRRHCPVLAECSELTHRLMRRVATRPVDCVQAGMVFTAGGQVSDRVAAPRCRRCVTADLTEDDVARIHRAIALYARSREMSGASR